MESPDRYRIALLSSYALALHGFEMLIPSPVPWLRLGLSNIVTLITLYLYGMKPALMVTMIRVLLGSLLLGTFLGPAFFLSLSGGLAGTLSMGIVSAAFPRLFSLLGLSLIGALSHNIAQLFFAYLLFVQRIEAVLVVAPVLIAAGTLTGAVNGIVSRYLIIEIEERTRRLLRKV
ncbi:MAG: Gx transporter family protein [Nitrospirae bacterium]|nr:Gx transporter family protein [Nitrospirota bacterium]